MTLKTPAQAKEALKAELDRRGESIASWAMANGLNPLVVYGVLSGKRNPSRGQSHKAAVLVGMKQGQE